MRSFNPIFFALALTASSVFASVLNTSLEARTTSYYDIDGGISDTYTGPELSLPSRTIHVPTTNAERFAAGLPPLPPARRSRRSGDRRLVASPLPSVTVSGTVTIRRADNNLLVGPMTQSNNVFNHLGAQGTSPVPIDISFPQGTSVLTQLEINAATTYAASWPLLGAISGVANSDDYFSSTASTFAYIQGTTHTPPGSPPASVSNSYPVTRDAESSIWSFDPITGRITATWINPDGMSVPAPIIFVPSADTLVITGSPTEFTNSFGGYEVTLTLTQPPT